MVEGLGGDPSGVGCVCWRPGRGEESGRRRSGCRAPRVGEASELHSQRLKNKNTRGTAPPRRRSPRPPWSLLQLPGPRAASSGRRRRRCCRHRVTRRRHGPPSAAQAAQAGSSVSSSPRAPSLARLRGGGSVAAGPPPDPAALAPLYPRRGRCACSVDTPRVSDPRAAQAEPAVTGEPLPSRGGPATPRLHAGAGQGRRRPGLAVLRRKASISLPRHPYSYPLAPPSIIHQNNRAAIFERDHVTPARGAGLLAPRRGSQ